MSKFWSGKRVLITGHTGFKGSWLSLWLQSKGALVTGYALPPPTSPSLFQALDLESMMTSIISDIRASESLLDAVRQQRPEIVFHLAAQPLVGESYRDPITTYETNVMGSLYLLEAIRTCGGVRALVMVTSDKCYKNTEQGVPFHEQDPMGGHDPYSSSKGCNELLISSFRDSFYPVDRHSEHGVAIASARAGNVIGGGDWAINRLIVDAIDAFRRGQPADVRQPQAIRPWQHVLEPLSGYMKLAQRLYEHGTEYSGAWNFGPCDSDTISVGEVLDRLCRIWGGGSSWTSTEKETFYEARALRLDCTKAHSRLDWQPKWSLNETLNRLVEWYRQYYMHLDTQSPDRIRTLSMQQIAAYEAL